MSKQTKSKRDKRKKKRQHLARQNTIANNTSDNYLLLSDFTDKGASNDSDLSIVQLENFDITREPMESPEEEKWPLKKREDIEKIDIAIVQEGRIRESLEELESLVELYPDVPRLQSHLVAAYEYTKQRDKAIALNDQLFNRFPDYIFAFANKVVFCVYRGDMQAAEELLNKRFLISHFARNRKLFHVTEVISYQNCVALYLYASGQEEAAQVQLKMLKQLQPDHPLVTQLARKMKPSLLKRIFGSRKSAKNVNRKLSLPQSKSSRLCFLISGSMRQLIIKPLPCCAF